MAALEEEIAEPLHALQALQSWPLNFQLPAEELLSYIQNNIEICRQIWPTYQDRHRQEITIHGNDSTFTFTLGPITTVASFLQARQSLFGTGSPNLPFQKWNPPFTRSLDEGGRLPHPDRSPKRLREVPQGMIVIKLMERGSLTQMSDWPKIVEPFRYQYVHGLRFVNAFRV